jgi:hypothetical protein
VLRFPMRLAKDLQCLKVKSYGHAAKAIDEIGRLPGRYLSTAGAVVPGTPLPQDGGPIAVPCAAAPSTTIR